MPIQQKIIQVYHQKMKRNQLLFKKRVRLKIAVYEHYSFLGLLASVGTVWVWLKGSG